MLIGRYLYNTAGDWIGWVDPQGLVFSARGEYVGWLARDFRILRKREADPAHAHREPPPAPPPERMPLTVPLPPLMAGISYDTLDVFEEAAYRLDPMDMDQVQDID
jgi:hypothetical protein